MGFDPGAIEMETRPCRPKEVMLPLRLSEFPPGVPVDPEPGVDTPLKPIPTIPEWEVPSPPPPLSPSRLNFELERLEIVDHCGGIVELLLLLSTMSTACCRVERQYFRVNAFP